VLVSRQRRSGAVAAALLSFWTQGPILAARAPRDSRNPERDDVIETVVRQELVETRGFGDKNVCLEVDGKDADKSTMRNLASHHLRLHRASRCLSCSSLRGGKIVRLWLSGRLDGGNIEVKAETADDSREQGDLGVLLRQGTYALIRDAGGGWKISRYTGTCCRAAHPSEPEDGATNDKPPM